MNNEVTRLTDSLSNGFDGLFGSLDQKNPPAVNPEDGVQLTVNRSYQDGNNTMYVELDCPGCE